MSSGGLLLGISVDEVEASAEDTRKPNPRKYGTTRVRLCLNRLNYRVHSLLNQLCASLEKAVASDKVTSQWRIRFFRPNSLDPAVNYN